MDQAETALSSRTTNHSRQALYNLYSTRCPSRHCITSLADYKAQQRIQRDCSGTPKFPTASGCQFWVRQPLTAVTAEMIEDKRHSICAVSKTAINGNHESSVKGGATQWAPLDAVQGLDAEQLEALPHDHGSRLAQQQPRVLLLLSQDLQHHMLVRKCCTAMEGFSSCE